MKKTLLVTTAALSLSLTSLAPITSFADTESKNNQISTTIPPAPASVIDRQAYEQGKLDNKDLVQGMVKALNTHSQKLGYEKGSKITVKVKSGLLRDSGHPVQSPGRKDISFYGSANVIFISPDVGDPSLKLDFNSKTNELTLEKVEDGSPKGILKMTSLLDYAYAPLVKYAGVPVRENDRLGTTFDTNSFYFTNY